MQETSSATTEAGEEAKQEAKQDAERIGAAISGLDHGTDPFVAAVRATRMPMIVTNPRLPDNPVVFVNDAFCRLTGYGRREILGRNCRFLQGPETDQAVVQQIRDAVAQVRSIEIDIRNYRKDGETFWNRLLLAPVDDAEGNLAFFFASQVDVTLERERMAGLETHNAALMAELAGRLREQQERESELRFALEAGRLGAWTLDIESGELTTSAVCRINFGRDPAAPFGYAVLKAAIHPDDRPRVDAAIEHSLTTGADYEVIYRVITPAGEIRWVAIRARPIRGIDRSVVRLSGVSQDITEGKRADDFKQALSDLGDLFRDEREVAALSYGASAILGRTLAVARAGYGTLDAAAATLTIEGDWTAPGVASLASTVRISDLGAGVEELQRGEAVVITDVAQDPRIAAAAGRPSAFGAVIHQPIARQDGHVALLFVTSATARAWHADDLAFTADVAHRMRAAIERRRAEQDLARLAASLEEQVAARTRELMTTEEALRQSQKMEAIGQLTGGVAHDFNNLLTVIASSVDLMRRPNLPEDRRRRYMDAIADTVARASRLTGQLLAFARRQALKPEPFDVGDRLRDIAEMLDTVTGSRIRVIVEQPDDPCFVHADVSQFETALVNMAVNARDAMDGAGVLTLSLRHAAAIPPIRGHAGSVGRFAAVAMADSGRGIGPGQIERIFEPFFTTKEVGKGTGLGLSQVFGFVKQSGGDVDVASLPGRGTVFTLYLPEIEAVPIGPAEDETGFGNPAAGGAGRRVLVVEDNVEVGRFSTQVLQDLGYETTWAANANEALATLGGTPEPFDVVFSDVVMPGKSGIELAKEIRQTYPGLPVVLTSGYSHVLAEQGASGFELLHKPYSAEQLSRVLRRASAGGRRRRSRPAASPGPGT